MLEELWLILTSFNQKGYHDNVLQISVVHVFCVLQDSLVFMSNEFTEFVFCRECAFYS